MRKILFYLLALTGVVFYSCQGNDPSGLDDKGGGGTPTIENGFTLRLTIPGTRANAYTTIAPVRTESDIYSLHLVFFERTSDASGQFKGFYSVDIDENSPLDIENPVDVRFEESSGLTNTEAYNILLVANLDWYLKDKTIEQWKASLPSMTEGKLIEETRAYIEGESDETIYSEGLDRIPMSTSAYKEAYASRVEVMLDRTVARIDINSYLGATYDFVTASIWNAFPYSSIWEGSVDYSTSRVQRYYGIRTEQSANGQYNSIEGGLYAFDNYVESPEANDRYTTCIIIGMRNLDPTASDYNKTLYYRVNIHSVDSPQELKRNNSYTITIRGVQDKGYPTELEAYLGEADKLDIVINYWDLDDDGIIQYDGDNVLAVPMKRINIPREGDEREYSIFTLGNGNLAITRNTLPAGINARLDGNMLYVDSDPLPASMESRSGELDFTFGTLKATVYVNQSGQTGEYLELSPAKLSLFPAYGVSTSETITIDASGPWTAKIYNEGFSFTSGGNVTEFKSSQGNSFTVSTIGSNPDNSSRLGFVIVSLDDKTEVNRSLTLQQRGKGGLTLTPDQEYVYFLANGNLHPTSNNTFTVDPGDDGYGVINPWTVELANESYFYISDYNYDPNNVAGNTFTVSPKGENTSVSQRTTTLKVYITDEPSVVQQMPVLQIPYSLSVNPTQFDEVPVAGATLGPVKVTSSTGTTWSATISTTTDASGHSAMLVDSKGNHVKSISGLASSEQFSIYFPRLTVTNTKPVATITVTLDGTDLKKTFTVSQTNLIPRALHVNSKGTSYATLDKKYSGYNYINVYGDNLYNPNYFGNLSNSVVKTAGTITYGHGYAKTLDSKITIFHANQGCHSYRESVIEWLKRDHRNFLSVSLEIDQSDQQKLLRLLSSSYTVASGGVATKVKRSLADTPQTYRNNKVWEYLVKTGPFTNGEELNINNTAFYNGDGTNGCLTSWPSTTIPIIMNPKKANAVMLAIDPVHKLLIIGDTEMFCRRNTASYMNDYTEGNDNWKFLNNMLAFMVNASMYGDDFLNEFR